MSDRSGRRGLLASALVLMAALGAADPARAGDIIVFVSQARPQGIWDRGYGAALTSTWFRVISLEGEAARTPGGSSEQSMTMFTGSAMLAPPIGILTPYGGVGVGLFRQTVGPDSELGSLKARVVGLKLRLGGLLVIKAEYRRLDLSGEPPLLIDERYSAGAGISF